LKITGIGRGHEWSTSTSFSEADAGIAIGFVAPPYPTFRLPGWQRGSLAVHGDDGRKYVNDTYGGVDFTSAFKPGEVVGIGMKFSLPRNPPSYDQSSSTQQRGVGMLDIAVFFTRNGVRDGGWDGNEELDERCEGGAVGLKGECDLYAAVGVFGSVDFEVFFSPEDWLYNPF
jgi:opacity protein-like surface antigen